MYYSYVDYYLIGPPIGECSGLLFLWQVTQHRPPLHLAAIDSLKTVYIYRLRYYCYLIFKMHSNPGPDKHR